MDNILRYHNLILAVTLSLFLCGAQAETLRAMEIAPGIYLRPGVHEEFSKSNRGHIANIGFILGSEKVAVIDTGSSYREGLALREKIRQVTDLPIAYVILTHMHLDHSLGAAAFSGDKPVFIGHQHLADALIRRQSVYLNRMKEILGEAAEGTRIVLPERTVSVGEDLLLDLGGRRLRLRAYPTAHTNNDLSVYDERTGTLWLSDLLFIHRVPIVDGSLLGWLKVMDQLSDPACLSIPSLEGAEGSPDKAIDKSHCLNVKQIVPGHGPVMRRWYVALANQRRYLETLANGVREVIKKGGTIKQAVETVGQEERDYWMLFDENHGRNVTAGFAELEWE